MTGKGNRVEERPEYSRIYVFHWNGVKKISHEDVARAIVEFKAKGGKIQKIPADKGNKTTYVKTVVYDRYETLEDWSGG